MADPEERIEGLRYVQKSMTDTDFFDADERMVFGFMDGTEITENSAMLESALQKCGVPVTHEIFPGTTHGWGMGDGTPAQGWFERAIAFWENVT